MNAACARQRFSGLHLQGGTQSLQGGRWHCLRRLKVITRPSRNVTKGLHIDSSPGEHTPVLQHVSSRPDCCACSCIQQYQSAGATGGRKLHHSGSA